MGNKKEKKCTQKNRKNSKKIGGKWFGLVADDKPQSESSDVDTQPSTVKPEPPSQFNAKPPKKTSDGKDYEPAGEYDANNFICGTLDGVMGRKPTKKDPIMIAKATEDVSSSIEPEMEDPRSEPGMEEPSSEPRIEEPSSEPGMEEPKKFGGKRSSKKKSDKHKRKDKKNKTKKVKGCKKNKKSKDKK